MVSKWGIDYCSNTIHNYSIQNNILEIIFKFADTFKEASGSVKSLDTKQERKNSSPQPTSPSTTTPASNVIQNGSSNTINRSSSVNSGGSNGSTNQEVHGSSYFYIFLVT